MSAVFVLNPITIAGLGSAPAAVLFPNASIGYGTGNADIDSGTAVQVLAAAKAGRVGWFIQSHDEEDLWIGIGRDPVVDRDLRIEAKAYFEMPAHMVSGDELRIRGRLGAKFFFVEA